MRSRVINNRLDKKTKQIQICRNVDKHSTTHYCILRE